MVDVLDLRVPTPSAWTRIVLDDLDAFLVDHAACERKASATGMSFVVRYPDRPEILMEMIAFAREELEHFQRVYQLLAARGVRLRPDQTDVYVERLLGYVRVGRDERLLDRLLVAGVIEARGCERFGMLADALPPGDLQELYRDLTRSEACHHALFVRLARTCAGERVVALRLAELLEREAELTSTLPLRPALH